MQLKHLSIFALLSAAASAQDLNSTIAGIPALSQLSSLLKSQQAVLYQIAGLKNITVLAPSNNAISALLNSTQGASLASNPALVGAFLQYHVLNGTYLSNEIPTNVTFVRSLLNNATYDNVTNGQRVGVQRSGSNVTFFSGLLQNSTVSQANINFTGGVVHVVNSALTLPQNVSSTLITESLSSFYGALNKTNLLATANGLKDVTIFAPSNAAFARIGSALTNISTSSLSSILEYHIVNGTTPLYSSKLNNGTQLKTYGGGNITITVGSTGSIFANGAEVVSPNVLIAGGVIHVIDNVLNPNSTAAAANGTATAGSPAFSGASSVSQTPFTTGVAGATSSANATKASASATASSASKGGSAPIVTGAVGGAVLFAAAGVLLNL